jgi:hypothetical protein
LFLSLFLFLITWTVFFFEVSFGVLLFRFGLPRHLFGN